MEQPKSMDTASMENSVNTVEQTVVENNERQEINPLGVGGEYEGYSEEGMKEDLENAKQLSTLVDRYSENLKELEKNYFISTSPEVARNGLSMIEQLKISLDENIDNGKFKSVKERSTIYQKFLKKYSELKLKGEILSTMKN